MSFTFHCMRIRTISLLFFHSFLKFRSEFSPSVGAYSLVVTHLNVHGISGNFTRINNAFKSLIHTAATTTTTTTAATLQRACAMCAMLIYDIKTFPQKLIIARCRVDCKSRTHCTQRSCLCARCAGKAALCRSGESESFEESGQIDV